MYPDPDGPGEAELRSLLQMPGAAGGPLASGEKPLPHLTALAAKWLAEASIPAEDRYARARRLERQLRESGEFTYSLQGQNRDAQIDPIEDFIANHPRGHCEYFATALALMLRSQGIPARVVIGYRTGEWIESAGFYQVRQLNAHTWVEVYLRREDLPTEKAEVAWAHGAWLRLDATPAAEGDSLGAWRHGLTAALGWLDFLWGRYVLDMDSRRHREAIYAPIVQGLKQAAANLVSPAWWGEQLGELWSDLGFNSDRPRPDSILGPLALATLLAVLILLCGYVLYRVIVVRIVRTIFGRRGRTRSRAERGGVLPQPGSPLGPVRAGANAVADTAGIRRLGRRRTRAADGRRPPGVPARRGGRSLLSRPLRRRSPRRARPRGGGTSVGSDRGRCEGEEAMRVGGSRYRYTSRRWPIVTTATSRRSSSTS